MSSLQAKDQRATIRRRIRLIVVRRPALRASSEPEMAGISFAFGLARDRNREVAPLPSRDLGPEKGEADRRHLLRRYRDIDEIESQGYRGRDGIVRLLPFVARPSQHER